MPCPARRLPVLFRNALWRALLPALRVLFALGMLSPAGAVDRIGVNEARQQALAGAITLIDIRRPEEWQASGIADVAIEIDMRAPDFLDRVRQLQLAHKDRPLAFICATGGRSDRLARWFEHQGVKPVIDVSAGMHGRNGWLAGKLPTRAPGTKPVAPTASQAANSAN